MDFTSYTVGGIDYSPAPWTTRATLVLEEPELRNATQDQFGRFMRVWFSERPTYAPSLIEVTLVLRAGYSDGVIDLRGINTFLDHCAFHIEHYSSSKGLHVYLDSYSAIIDHTQYSVLDTPLLLFTIAAEPPLLPASYRGILNSSNSKAVA